MSTTGEDLEREKHVRFLRRCVNLLPSEYTQQDNNHLTLLYFVVGALDLLGELDCVTRPAGTADTPEHREKMRETIVDYVYRLQILPTVDGNTQNCGFVGSPAQYEIHPQFHQCKYVISNVAMTYVALCLLVLLRDDFSRINVPAILKGLRALQQPDGSFSAVCVPGGGECDVRFVYCACVISHFLNDWSGIDKEKAINFIISTQTYDGAFGQRPHQESHGGSTYCALASLALLGELHRIPRMDDLVAWLVDRQLSGFQGRANKPPDTCYSWWVGASLTLLGKYNLIDFSAVEGFNLSCQASIGGFSKVPDVFPDVLHTYYSLCGLSLGGRAGLKPLDCMLGLTKDAASHLPRR
eukprot:TRINITY_DN4774_c0_g1_i1.p1 TRINITY_DN4774_c0_g1~~TRINITY_DN4774_c0_g1_i1.p1  ORF type:complete len:354 (-),score=72.53 TRINITY_DN4774_c0_g1_i1:70-1131(-)